LFGGKKAPLSTSAALMANEAAAASTPPAQPQKTAKAPRANAEATATVTATKAALAEPSETVEAPVKKAPKKRAAPRKRKAAEAAVQPEAPVDETLTADASAKHVAAQFAPQRAAERDVWFSDAVAWTLNGQWSSDQAWSPPPSSEGPKRLEEFREKAAEGKLVIWGRAGDVGMWEPIEANYWKCCGIEQFSFLEGREKVFTEPKTPAKPKPGKSKNAAKYTALMVSKRQVEEVWQPDTMH
jgi:hypothetical protein